MKLSCLSFALLWASSLFAAAVPFNESVQANLSTRSLRPVQDDEPRYFLPGSSLLGTLVFMELDLRTDLEREELKGPVKKRFDYYPGARVIQSEVDYDAKSRRVQERVFDQADIVLFERLYLYAGSGAVPESLAELDGNGVTRTATDFVLDARGMPLEEDHTDYQGLPLLHRAYRYDNGRLASFTETEGAAIRGTVITWSYDHKGRLIGRKGKNKDLFKPIVVTDWERDWGSGRLLQRIESAENLPVGPVLPDYPESDIRRHQLYRVLYEENESLVFFDNEKVDTNNAFWKQKYRFKFNAGGWLDEKEFLNEDGELLSREFWEWDSQNSLTRYESWGRPGGGLRNLSFEYEYDAHGNWIRRKSDRDDESVERKFEYYDE